VIKWAVLENMMTNNMEMTELLDIAKNIPTIKELYKKRDELQSQVIELDRKSKLLKF